MADMHALALPETMIATGFDAPGGCEVLTLRTVPVPRPLAGQVLVKVAFAGVNRPDVAQRMGLYPPPPGASPLPGLEISGTVFALGEGVDPGELGRQVCALVPGGGYAEYCLARPEHCLPVPAGLPLAEAAALPETLFTVWHNLFERGHVRDGETVLVHGGTSGIGTMAILLGKAFDIVVIVTCGGPDKCARSLELGAAHAIARVAARFKQEIVDDRAGQQLIDAVADDRVRLAAADLHDRPRPRHHAPDLGDEPPGLLRVAIFGEVFHVGNRDVWSDGVQAPASSSLSRSSASPSSSKPSSAKVRSVSCAEASSILLIANPPCTIV